MKIQRSIFGFVVVVVLIAFVFWLGRKKPAEMPPAGSIETNAPSAATVTNPVTSLPVHSNTLPAQLVANAAATPKQDKGKQIKEGLATLNDVPIAFYGKLEDQFGSPVVGAQIAASVRIYNGVRSTVDRFSATSDGNGFFQINHGKGESLSIVPSKKGYVLATKDTYFKYSYMYLDHFSPDPNNPTVVKMWKLQGAEPLVSIDKTYKLSYTNAPINFDLAAGQIVSTGGDIKITVNRPSGEVSEHNPQKWNIDFEVIDGGFIETSDKEWGATYAAPEGGYQPSGIFGNNNGTDGIDKAFFIQSRSGQIYSKVGFSFRINNKPDDLMYIRFSGVANTNGSHNWEATAPQ